MENNYINRNTIIIGLVFIIIIMTIFFSQNKENKYIECEELKGNNEIVYSKRSCNIKDDFNNKYELNMPYINLKGDNIAVINNSIAKDFNSSLNNTTYNKKENKKKFANIFLFDYKIYTSNDYVSLIIEDTKLYYGSSEVDDISIYNIDLKQNKIAKKEEIIKNLNIKLDNNDFINALIDIYKNEYSYDYSRQDPAYLDLYVYKYIYYFDYIKNSNIIINSNGNLVFLLQIVEPNTGYKRYCYLEIVDNKIKYSFDL